MFSEPERQKDKISSPWKEDEKLGNFGSGKEDNINPKMKTFSKIIVVILFLAVAGFGYYYFTRPAGANVAMEFSRPDQIFSGQPFVITISVSNNSDQVLKNAKLSLYLPDKVYNLNGSQNQRVIESALGDVGPGSVAPNNFRLLVVGDSQTLKHIESRFSYQLNGSSAEFENKSAADLSVGQRAIDLSFDAPQSVFSGSSFDVKVKYQNNSGRDFNDNVILKIDYPSGFQFAKSSADVMAGNNQWSIGKLAKGASGELIITGGLFGTDNSSFDFHGAVSTGGRDFGGQDFTISEQVASISILSSPLFVSLSINGSDNYIARAGDQLSYNFHYKNNSTTTFENITIKASLSGEMLDFATSKSDAFFTAAGNTFTWMTANVPALAKLSPGDEGTARIEIKLKSDFPIRRISDKNFLLKTLAEISSPTVPQGTTATKTVSVANFETKVAGKVTIQTKAFWRDASSGILNNGPYPPRVNRPTQYTIHWLLKNYSTDVSGVTVSAFLQSGARWTGKIKSNTIADPSYDSSSGKVTWNVGDLMATKGVISQQPEAIFQVEVTPAVNQLGQIITFLDNTSLQWQDNFVNANFNDVYRAMTTFLDDDTTIGALSNKGVQQ